MASMTRKDEPVTLRPATVRDDLVRHVERALRALRVRHLTDAQIHTARKQLKRARANLRVLRDAIGKTVYARENAALRDAARPLSGVRDAKVLVETADMLIDAARTGPRRTLLLKARKALEKARHEARGELKVMNGAKDSAAALSAASMRMRRWRLGQPDATELRKGLKRVYRRGREAFESARQDPTPQNLHEWRKQVKYLEQAMQTWKPNGAKRVGKLAKRADRLGATLGIDHDLVVFEERLENLDAPARARPDITRNIARRRRTLRRKALNQGRRLFESKPRAFVRDVASAG
jgi:CHAD domain-containing protein